MSSKPLGFGNRHIEPNPAAVKDKLSLAASMKPTPVSDDLPTANADTGSVAEGGTVNVSVLGNDLSGVLFMGVGYWLVAGGNAVSGRKTAKGQPAQLD